MRAPMIFAAGLLTLVGCGTAQQTAITKDLGTPAGQLFCQVNTALGPTVVAAIDGAANPAAAPVAVLATGAAASLIQADCAAAATAVGAAAGIPVSPPSAPVANVAITPAH